jgi:hypothetical protein
MIDLIPLIGKIAPACIKKFLSYLRNRPYVHVTAELGTRPGIHAVAIHRNRMRQSPILNTDEPAIKIRCVNETTHKCFLDRIEINFENKEPYMKSYDNIELSEGNPEVVYITLDELNLDMDFMPRKHIKKITVFDTVRGIWNVERTNIDLLNRQIFH